MLMYQSDTFGPPAPISLHTVVDISSSRKLRAFASQSRGTSVDSAQTLESVCLDQCSEEIGIKMPPSASSITAGDEELENVLGSMGAPVKGNFHEEQEVRKGGKGGGGRGGTTPERYCNSREL
jgi:hypothetical protein